MLLTVFICLVLASLVVVIHYEALRLLTSWLPELNIRPRKKVVVALTGALLAHSLEIQIFALGFYLMVNLQKLGIAELGQLHDLRGAVLLGYLDCSYYSFSNYTSLGLGDIFPIGHVRFLTGLEALVGLVMITWTASFMYLEMQKFWVRNGVNK